VKDGICPKCGQASVYECTKGVTYGNTGAGPFVIEGGWGSVGHECDTHSYLCTGCGYFENYIDDAEMLAKVHTIKKWTLVSPGR
jgi:hypothetical protein